MNYKYNMRSSVDHEELVEVLKDLKSRFVLTTYDRTETNLRFHEMGFVVHSVDFAGGVPAGGGVQRPTEPRDHCH